MSRRKAYTKVKRLNRVLAQHVKGMGDVVFKGFQCLNPECTQFIFVREDNISADFSIICPACGFKLYSGGASKFFDYQLVFIDEEIAADPASETAVADTNEMTDISPDTSIPENDDVDTTEGTLPDSISAGIAVEEGEFTVNHASYILEAQRYKYCILCNTLKPLEYFDKHSSRGASGRQGECKLCKHRYNSIKNKTRTTDQHREAARRRRLFALLAGESHTLDSRRIFDKFGGKCFKCGTTLTYTARGNRDFDLDHTLPNRYLWPITTENATLLCRSCNNQKHDRWPSEVYTDTQLRRLAYMTAFPYELISGTAVLNDNAVRAILEDVDGFIIQWIRYPNEIRKVRTLILEKQSIDIFEHAHGNVPEHLKS